MSGQTPPNSSMIIEPSEFARRGESRSGVLGLTSLPRVSEAVLGINSGIEWRAQGEVGRGLSDGASSAGKGWFLVLSLEGSVTVRCQRCLEPMALPVSVVSRFLMVPENQPLPDEELEEDRFDALPVGMELNLAELIEDELLLCLPVVPRHEQCVVPEQAEDTKEQSPFAVLAQLKSRR